MKIMIAFLLFAIMALSDTNGINSKLLEDKIINGVNVPHRSKTSLVSIRNNCVHYCSGTLIHIYYVLTTASCIIPILEYYENERSFATFNISLGSTKISSKGYHTTSISNVHIHKDYRVDDSQNVRNSYPVDVGVIKLDKRATAKIISYTENFYPPSGTSVVLMGWGSQSTTEQPILSTILKSITLDVLTNTECGLRYNYTIDPRLICVAEPTKTRNIGKGDSGIPLLVDNKLLGIVVAGSFAFTRYPAIGIRLSAITEYIKQAKRYLRLNSTPRLRETSHDQHNGESSVPDHITFHHFI